MGCLDYLANTSGGFGRLGKENLVQFQRHQYIHRTNATQLKKKHEVTGTQCINQLKKGDYYVATCWPLSTKVCVCVCGHRCHAPRQAGRPHIAHSYSVRIPDKEN